LGLAPLAAGAESKEFQGVKQGLESLEVGLGQLQAMDGAMGQPQGVTAVDTGEMVLIPLGGSKERLATGEVPAAHQPPLLQLAQVAIHRGQPHGPLPCSQTGMEILAGDLIVRLPQHRQQVLLAGR
jgi:hypothetical protein